MTSGKPIKPSEVAQHKTRTIPGPVFDAFNTLIAKHWNGTQATFKQDDVVAEILRRYPGSQRHELFENGYLDVEESYRAEGWLVEYDKPAYNETYAARFTFRRKADT